MDVTPRCCVHSGRAFVGSTSEFYLNCRVWPLSALLGNTDLTLLGPRASRPPSWAATLSELSDSVVACVNSLLMRAGRLRPHCELLDSTLTWVNALLMRAGRPRSQ